MLKQLTAEEFLKQLDPSIHQAVKQVAIQSEATAVVYFENRQLDSSARGRGTALVVGPTCKYKTPEATEGNWLNDLPSQRQYPQNWCPADEIIAAIGAPVEPKAKVTLADHLPEEFLDGSYTFTEAYKYRDVRVLKIYSLSDEATWRTWPGPHKNVSFWVVLDNGKAVGWNENPGRGWSFPVFGYKESEQ